MTIGMLFWILMIISLVFGLWRGYSDPAGRFGLGFPFLLWVLLFLLGWKVFGFPIQG